MYKNVFYRYILIKTIIFFRFRRQCYTRKPSKKNTYRILIQKKRQSLVRSLTYNNTINNNIVMIIKSTQIILIDL